MTARDVPTVASLHRAAFPAYQSSQLGPRFCHRLFDAYLRQPATIALVRDRDGSPDAFLVACPAEIQRKVNHELLPSAALAAARALLSPSGRRFLRSSASRGRARRALAAVGRARHRVRSGRPPRHPTEPVEMDATDVGPIRVVLVGVSPGSRGTGAGDDLLRAFAVSAAAGGHTVADLVVETTNVVARRLYERHGWVLVPSTGDEASVRYERCL